MLIKIYQYTLHIYNITVCPADQRPDKGWKGEVKHGYTYLSYEHNGVWYTSLNTRFQI